MILKVIFWLTIFYAFMLCVMNMCFIKFHRKYCICCTSWGFPGGSVIKNLPAMQEKRFRSLNWEDPLEEGTGNPLQCSCWRILMDRGAWQTTVHGSQNSWTQLNDWTRMHAHILARKLYICNSNKNIICQSQSSVL